MTPAAPTSVPPAPDDRTLLAAYAQRADQAAFATLVHRHADLVYNACLRRARGDPHLADDATQAVFLLLARRASRLKPTVLLTGWLYNTARYAAANAVRAESRRRRHERQAATARLSSPKSAMPTVTPPAGSTDTATLDDLTPILDAAVNRLPTADRHAILLRYFENKPVRDVATVLAISEDAAKKRCARAVEKLRHLLTARGLPATALALAAILPATNTHAAPPAVISAACGLALPGAAAPASISLIAGKTLLMTQLKLTAALVVTLLLATGGLGYAAHVLRDQVPVERHARPPAPAVSLAADAPLAPAAPCREPIEGVIVRADGAPLADVEVYLATPQKRYAFYATRQTNKPQVTDSDGKFSFPRTSPPWVVVARTPDGR